MKIATRILALFLLVSAGLACDRPTPVAPASSTLTIAANPTRIGVNGEATITVLARKADGTAVNPGTEINFSTDLGTIDPVATTDDGGIAEATLRGDGRIGLATVSVESGAATAPEDIQIQIGALASSITLASNKSEVNKDLPPGGERIKLTAQVFDDLNNTIKDIAVIFESPIGTFEEGGSVETNFKGIAKNVLALTEVRNVEDGFFTITARTVPDEAGGATAADVTATFDIDVIGFALNISLSAQPASVPVSGGTIQLLALVRDDLGGAAVGEGVNFIAEVGRLASRGGLIATDANGQARDTLNVSEAELGTLVGAAPLTLTVTAEVAIADGSLQSDTVDIAVEAAPPIAGFGITSITDRNVVFNNTTTGDAPITYLWDFGDGFSSNEFEPSHLYGADGTFFVTLTATNESGSDSFTSSVTVMEDPGANPALAISIIEASFTDNDLSTDRSAGDFLNFEIVATNAGDVDLTGVTVVASLALPALTCTPAISPTAVLQPTETITCTQAYTVTAADVTAGQVSNTATADNATAIAVADTVVVFIP